MILRQADHLFSQIANVLENRPQDISKNFWFHFWGIWLHRQKGYRMDVKLFLASAIRFWEAYWPIPKRNASNSEKINSSCTFFCFLWIASSVCISLKQSGPENLKKSRQKNSWNHINQNFFFVKLHFPGHPGSAEGRPRVARRATRRVAF